MVPKVIFGSGSFNCLEAILLDIKQLASHSVVFLVDDVFKEKPLKDRLPNKESDLVLWISAEYEPKTDQVDQIVETLRMKCPGGIAGVVGIGGGTLLDLAKAVSVMFNNSGYSSDYQGWDLVEHKGLYHIGIPTLSGTGSEISRTAVLSGPERKLGINSDFVVFDQVILDPELTAGVPKAQWFYTGMDCYIHCVESLSGTFLNAFSQSYGEKALELCKEVFLKDLDPVESRQKLMMASWHGGMSIAYSQVGIAHALSYGLSFALGTPHGLGNCLVFKELKDYYPEGVEVFHQMMYRHGIELPKGIGKHLTTGQLEVMTKVALSLHPLWENALGIDWRDKISPEVVMELYRKI